MGYSYHYNVPFEEALGSIMAVNSISAAISFALNIVLYVLTALSLYAIARHRGISKAWLAWIPVLDMWILGSISDQYRYVVKGENKSKRKWLLTFNILTFVMSVVFAVIVVMMVVTLIIGLSSYGQTRPVMEQGFYRAVFGALGSSVVILVLSIGYAVIYFMALYDLYTSCDPRNNVLYLVLSIVPVISTFAKPIFLFLCRDKDEGMPPRRPEPQYGARPANWYEESQQGKAEWYSEQADPNEPWNRPE